MYWNEKKTMKYFKHCTIDIVKTFYNFLCILRVWFQHSHFKTIQYSDVRTSLSHCILLLWTRRCASMLETRSSTPAGSGSLLMTTPSTNNVPGRVRIGDRTSLRRGSGDPHICGPELFVTFFTVEYQCERILKCPLSLWSQALHCDTTGWPINEILPYFCRNNSARHCSTTGTKSDIGHRLKTGVISNKWSPKTRNELFLCGSLIVISQLLKY